MAKNNVSIEALNRIGALNDDLFEKERELQTAEAEYSAMRWYVAASASKGNVLALRNALAKVRRCKDAVDAARERLADALEEMPIA